MKPITAHEFDLLYVEGDIYHTGSDKGKWYADYAPSNFISANTGRADFWAWGFGRLGMALIYMYRATRDTKYLDWLVPQIDYIIARRDIDLGVITYTGTSLILPVWSMDGAKHDGQNLTHNLLNALICNPILRFVEAVREHRLVQYYGKISQYLTVCGDALDVFNGEDYWHEVDPTKGIYRFVPFGDNIPKLDYDDPDIIHPPLNYPAGYIDTLALYQKITGETKYTDRIIKCLNWIKSFFQYDPTGNYIYWAYRPNVYPTRWEDISHAQVTMSILNLQLEHGYSVFSNVDLNRIANTIARLVDNSTPPKVTRRLHGEPYLNYEDMTSQWGAHYYEAAARYSVFYLLGPEVIQSTLPVARFIVDNWDDLDGESQNSRRLYAIAATIFAQSQTWKKDDSWIEKDSAFEKVGSRFVRANGSWKKIVSKFIR